MRESERGFVMKENYSYILYKSKAILANMLAVRLVRISM